MKARFVRSTLWSVASFGFSQLVRFASNLVLAKLLFPEAFGLIAIVLVFMIGLAMLSDVGISQSIQSNKRGDEPDFLDTAWTIQALRGVLLWGCACILAIPIAAFYKEPILAELIPVAGLNLVLTGLNPIRVHTAVRHLQIGRLSFLEIIAQCIGVIVMIINAYVFASVWSLVVGMVTTSAAKLILIHYFLSGHRSRFHLDKSTSKELMHFGKWIFLSTLCGFLLTQGDRLILGIFLSAELLGIYSIGYFIASFPNQLGMKIVEKVFLPLYRERPPSIATNFRRLSIVRFVITGLLFSMALGISYLGPLLITTLYDPRYAMAGGVVTMLSLVTAIQIITASYDRAALAAGDSRGMFFLTAVRAAVQSFSIILGLQLGGVFGAIAGQGLSILATYPFVVWLARRHKAWDPLHDATFFVLGFIVGAVVLWIKKDTITGLSAFGIAGG